MRVLFNREDIDMHQQHTRTARPDIYVRANAKAKELACAALLLGKLAWALDSAARNYRVAETDQEKQCAVDCLYAEMAKHAKPVAAE